MADAPGAPGAKAPADPNAEQTAATTDTAGDPKATPGEVQASAAGAAVAGQVQGQAFTGFDQAAADVAAQRLPAPVPDQPDAGGDYTPTTDEEKFLFSPSKRPTEGFTAGMQGNRVAPPKNAKMWYPVLVQASQDPAAPPQLILMARLISYFMES